MRAVILVMAACVAAACSSTSSSSTSASVEEVVCEDPPPAELDAESMLDMSVQPQPASARETVDLMVSSAGLDDDALAGVDARWQCWDGTQWQTTHIIYRGFGDNPGQTILLNPEFLIQVPSIGLALDEGYAIVIPHVEQGRYRIEDDVIVDGEPTNGFVIVEVTDD